MPRSLVPLHVIRSYCHNHSRYLIQYSGLPLSQSHQTSLAQTHMGLRSSYLTHLPASCFRSRTVACTVPVHSDIPSLNSHSQQLSALWFSCTLKTNRTSPRLWNTDTVSTSISIQLSRTIFIVFARLGSTNSAFCTAVSFASTQTLSFLHGVVCPGTWWCGRKVFYSIGYPLGFYILTSTNM